MVGINRRKGGVLALLLLISIILLVSVQPAECAVNLSLLSDKQVLVAGTENTIRFTISNLGNTAANEVIASATIGTSLTGGNLMMIVGGDGRFDLSTIGPGENKSFTMTVYVSPSAAGQILQISFSISYRGDSVTTTATRSVGFSVPNKDLESPVLVPRLMPNEFRPGQNNTAYLIIENTGMRDARNVTLVLGHPGGAGTSQLTGSSSLLTALTPTTTTVQGSSQFIIYDSAGRWVVDSVGANGTVAIPVTIYALASTAGSVFLFPVQLSYSDGFTYVQETKYAGIRVLPAPSETTSFSISLSTQEVIAGRINHLDVTLKNIGSGPVSGAVLGIGFSGSQLSSIASTGSVSIPQSSSLVLIGSDGTWVIGDLSQGEEAHVNVSVYVPPSSAGSVATLSTSLFYTDSLQRSKQETKQAGILVKGQVDLIVLETSTFPQNVSSGKPFSVSVTMINLGTSPAKSAILTPSGTGELRPVTSDRIFIGDIAVDVPSSFTLSLVGDNLTSGVYNLNLTYTYKDSLSQIQENYLIVPINIKVTTNSNGQAQPAQPAYQIFLNSYWPYILALAALLVLTAMLLRRRKRGNIR
ncbi:MAG: hypothetical protein QXX77_02485 [Candidatus Methanosuratincola sp.]